MMRRSIFSILAVSLIVFNLSLADLSLNVTSADSHLLTHQEAHSSPSSYSAAPESGYFVRVVSDGETICREATVEEARVMSERDPNLLLQEIPRADSKDFTSQADGLKIILRSTPQLDAFPQAKAAFVKAAATWESLIQSPITIILDVDFGPTRFGTAFPEGVIGSTSTQTLVGNTYASLRQRLITGASSPAETSLYSSLLSSVPTDLGSTTTMLSPSALLRAIGEIEAVANPNAEGGGFGPPPAIGFNSNLGFDFDPSNGIDPDKFDFDSVAVHEIGHALGFASGVGLRELDPSSALRVSVWDLFRFRPGSTLGGFPTANRILSSGGDHVFFGGGPELGLSTGRPNGAAGDGRQASHWKDDNLAGRFVGIMDPTSSFGEQDNVTANDLIALDTMGYRVNFSALPPTVLSRLLPPSSPRSGLIPAPPPGSGVLDQVQYTIQVPAGTTQVKVDLSGNQDVDLFIRFGQRVAIQNGQVQADYSSASTTGSESVTISSSSAPALREGVYYVGIGNFGPGATGFTLTSSLTGSGNNTPVVTRLVGSLDGDVLTLTGTATDADGDVGQAQVSILDSLNTVVGRTQPFTVNFGPASINNFTLRIGNMSQLPTGVIAGLVLIDRNGNRSASITADFSQPDAGGPTISKISYNGSKLKIKGKALFGALQLEINGQVVGLISNDASKKASFKGNSTVLNLRAGPNRVRVRNGSLRSNLSVYDF